MKPQDVYPECMQGPNDPCKAFQALHQQNDDLESELNRAQSNVKRQGIMLSKAMGEFIELTDELKEANDAIDTLKDLVRSSYAEGYDVGFDNKFFGTDTEQMSLFWSCWKDSNSKKAIDRALKES